MNYGQQLKLQRIILKMICKGLPFFPIKKIILAVKIETPEQRRGGNSPWAILVLASQGIELDKISKCRGWLLW